MALDPRLSDAFRTNPARAAAAQGVPSTPASATEWPHAPVEPRATLRPVDPATGAYRQPGAAPTATTAPAAPPTSTIGSKLPPNAGPAAGAPQLDPVKDVVKQPGKLSQFGSKAANVLGSVAAGATMLNATRGSMEADSTARYAKRFGMNEPTGDGSAGDIAKFAALRTLGYASDLGNDLTFGLAGKYLYQDKPGAQPTAQPTPATQPKPDLKNPYAAENAAKIAAAGAQPTAPTQPTAFDRSNMSNADVIKANPAGKVTMTREPNGTMSFSGSNISGPVGYAGADGQALPGKGLRGNSWGNVNVLDSSEGRAVNNRLAAQFDARIASEIAAAQQAARSAGEASGGAGFNSREARDLLSQAMTKQPGESRADFATRSGAAMKMLGLETDERGNIRTNDTSRRGQDITQSTTLRGQDMDLTGKILPKQMEMEAAARMRQLNANIWKEAGGDPRRAAALAQSVGMDGKNFMDMADAQRKLTDANRAASDRQFEHRAVTTDDKGNPVINNALAATSRNIREQLAPGYDSMTPEEQAEKRPYLDAGMNVVEGMNSLRKDGLLKYLGIDDAPALSTLPDLTGAEHEEVGLFKGMFTPSVERGDRKVTLRDGTVRYIPREKFNENERALLRDLK